MTAIETEWESLYREYSLGNYGTPPLTLVEGQGTKIWDDQGKEDLDFVCGIAVTSIGHCHPIWVKRIQVPHTPGSKDVNDPLSSRRKMCASAQLFTEETGKHNVA